jgi:hypothetical protein
MLKLLYTIHFSVPDITQLGGGYQKVHFLFMKNNEGRQINHLTLLKFKISSDLVIEK